MKLFYHKDQMLQLILWTICWETIPRFSGILESVFEALLIIWASRNWNFSIDANKITDN